MVENKTKYCVHCGTEIDEEAVICPSCGVIQTPQLIKDPGVAAIFSVFFTGLGQIYNGQILKGIALIVFQVINFFLMFVGIGWILYPIVWIYGIWDAYDTAKNITINNVQEKV